MKKLVTSTRPAVVIAFVALVASLTGGAYAAGLVTSADIRNGTVQNKDVKRNTLKTDRVKNGSLRREDFRAGEAGPVAWARITETGDVDESASKNITDANVSLESTSAYCFRSLGFDFGTAVATAEYNGGSAGESVEVAVAPNGFTDDCAGGAQVEVAGVKGADYAPVSFYIVFN